MSRDWYCPTCYAGFSTAERLHIHFQHHVTRTPRQPKPGKSLLARLVSLWWKVATR